MSTWGAIKMRCEGQGCDPFIYLFTISAKHIDLRYKQGEHRQRHSCGELRWRDARPLLTTNVMQMFKICIISMQT